MSTVMTTLLTTTHGEPPGERPALPRGQRYVYGPVIGRGGMGEILTARDEQFGRSVAIKRLHERAATPGAIGRFVREAQIQGRLEHPAIVPVHELWYDSLGRPCFAMKQLAGITLGDIINRLAAGDVEGAKVHTTNRLLQVFIEVCLAVELAHTRGVIHCDLKPSNIVVGDFGEVYVLDWGIAQVIGDPSNDAFPDLKLAIGTGTTPVAGTPGYMSPEQIRGARDLDGRSDVYSLGCVLFEILARETLHPRGTPGLASTLEGTDARPSARVRDLDIAPELDAICVSALAFDAVDRPPSARALADAVRRYLDGDRDQALRTRLAADAVADARDALADGDGLEQRRLALRAAGRALALDPTNRDAEEVIAGLLVRPIDTVPPEVGDALARAEAQTLFHARWITVGCALAALAFIPLFYFAGFHSPYLHVGYGALMIAKLVSGLVTNQRNALVMSRFAVPLSFAIIAIYAYLLTPVLVAPAVASTTAIAMACAPRRVIRTRMIFAIAFTATLAPWLLELVGISASSMTFSGGDVTLHTAAAHLDPVFVRTIVIGCLMLAIVAGVARARIITRAHRAAHREIQLRAWQLRQLL